MVVKRQVNFSQVGSTNHSSLFIISYIYKSVAHVYSTLSLSDLSSFTRAQSSIHEGHVHVLTYYYLLPFQMQMLACVRTTLV